MRRIGLIDYGAGNFMSVYNALHFLDVDIVRVIEPQQMDQVSHLILPGVGAFASAMRKLERTSILEALQRQLTEIHKPFLGICVGMQILASLGREYEDYPGIGVIAGVVDRLPAEKYGLRLPHIGWNELKIIRPSPIFAGMPDKPILYFAHSYHLQSEATETILATCQYGIEIVAIVECGNIYGVQFHPEKSQHDGLQLLKNFTKLKT